MIQNLFLVEHADRNSQRALGNGWGKILQPAKTHRCAFRSAGEPPGHEASAQQVAADMIRGLFVGWQFRSPATISLPQSIIPTGPLPASYSMLPSWGLRRSTSTATRLTRRPIYVSAGQHKRPAGRTGCPAIPGIPSTTEARRTTTTARQVPIHGEPVGQRLVFHRRRESLQRPRVSSARTWPITRAE